MTYLRKNGDKPIGEHIRTFKGLCDSLAAIGKPVPDKENVFCLITSLGPQYETFTTTMLKPPRPTYYELVSQLQSLDQCRSWFSNHTTPSPFSSLVTFLANTNAHLPDPLQNSNSTEKTSPQLAVAFKPNSLRFRTKATPAPLHPLNHVVLRHQASAV